MTVLNEANDLIYGAREEAYAHPYTDYSRTVALFNTWSGRDLTVAEAVAFMVFVKLSREAHRHQRDNLVDAAGYIGCWARVIGEDE